MPKPARLIIAILTGHPEILVAVKSGLTASLGAIIHHSELINWNFSRYYEPELGPDLKRQWVLFEPLVNPGLLAQFKKTTMQLEDRWRDEKGNRQVNLDPGILTLHNLVLATTKDYSHRIAVDPDIYAEVTMIFHRGKFQPLPWTYPDYQTETCQNFLLACRETLRASDRLP